MHAAQFTDCKTSDVLFCFFIHQIEGEDSRIKWLPQGCVYHIMLPCPLQQDFCSWWYRIYACPVPLEQHKLLTMLWHLDMLLKEGASIWF